MWGLEALCMIKSGCQLEVQTWFPLYHSFCVQTQILPHDIDLLLITVDSSDPANNVSCSSKARFHFHRFQSKISHEQTSQSLVPSGTSYSRPPLSVPLSIFLVAIFSSFTLENTIFFIVVL